MALIAPLPKVTYIFRTDTTLPTTSEYYGNASYDANVALSYVEHYPYYSNFLGLEVKYTASYSLTQMPIPTQNTPFLLNFTGPTLGLSFTWSSITQSDLPFLLEFFPTANPSVSIVADLTTDWGSTSSTNNLVTEKYNDGSAGSSAGTLRFVGIVDTFSVSEVAGKVIWDYQMMLKLGKIIG